MSNKPEIIEGLHHIQTLLYDSSEALGDIVVGRPKIKLTLAAIYDRIVQSEEILESIMEQEFWS